MEPLDPTWRPSWKPSWQEAAGLEYLPAPDPLWRRVPLPLTARYTVFGVSLAFATNAPVLAELAEETFGEWGRSDESHPEAHPDETVRLHVLLQDVPEAEPKQRDAALCRSQGAYYFVVIGKSMGFADHATGFATAFVTPALLSDRRFVQAAVLECLSFFLLSRYRPATLHAAGVVHRGRCLLITGKAGAGKSTLAYACLRAGMGLLAEDVVFATPTHSPLQVWGVPWRLHLLPDALRFFPELERAERIEPPHGETKLCVRVKESYPAAPVTQSPVWGVLSLGRAPGAASRLQPADPEPIRTALTHFKGDPPLDRTAMATCVDALLQGPVAHLDVGSDLDHAVQIVRAWLESDALRME